MLIQKIELQMFDPKGKDTNMQPAAGLDIAMVQFYPEPKPDEVYLDEKLKKLQRC